MKKLLTYLLCLLFLSTTLLAADPLAITFSWTAPLTNTDGSPTAAESTINLTNVISSFNHDVWELKFTWIDCSGFSGFKNLT